VNNALVGHAKDVSPREIERPDQVHVGVGADVARGFPSLRKTAELVGVNVSTLSRQRDLPTERVGRETRVAPRVVLDLALYYRRRDIHAVAFDLVSVADAQAPEVVEAIETYVNTYLAAYEDHLAETRNLDPAAFLEAARAMLPAHLYAEVEAAARQDRGATRAGA
jgi:hypothetical protein